jgi:hypothetical protein
MQIGTGRLTWLDGLYALRKDENVLKAEGLSKGAVRNAGDMQK